MCGGALVRCLACDFVVSVCCAAVLRPCVCDGGSTKGADQACWTLQASAVRLAALLTVAFHFDPPAGQEWLGRPAQGLGSTACQASATALPTRTQPRATQAQARPRAPAAAAGGPAAAQAPAGRAPPPRAETRLRAAGGLSLESAHGSSKTALPRQHPAFSFGRRRAPGPRRRGPHAAPAARRLRHAPPPRAHARAGARETTLPRPGPARWLWLAARTRRTKARPATTASPQGPPAACVEARAPAGAGRAPQRRRNPRAARAPTRGARSAGARACAPGTRQS